MCQQGKPVCLRMIKLKPEKNIRLFKGSQSHPIDHQLTALPMSTTRRKPNSFKVESNKQV